jgi:type IV secretory pathway VirD2 relaxase
VAKKTDGEREFRLRPNRPPKGRTNESIAWSVALKTVFRYASTSRRRASHPSTGSGATRKKHFNQRCAVRITYTKNKVSGQWRAHGRYIARESAAQEFQAGFNAATADLKPAPILDQWQKQGDPRLWKFIVSPEFGERVDLQRLTRELMQGMEADLETRLEWVAVNHFNTEHPHVHVALRGVRDDGSVLDVPREYVKAGIRLIAEDLCTRQLGYRTELDAREAQRREVDQCRVTSLDRIINRAQQPDRSEATTGNFKFRTNNPPGSTEQALFLSARLLVLEKMGLATLREAGTWDVRSDFQTVLKAMQQVADRQKTLSAHRALISDERLPLVVTEPRGIRALEGRVLGHGEDENGRNCGRHYMLLEGIDAKIHLIYYTPALEEARSRGELATNSFVQLKKRFENGRPMLEVASVGDAERLLDNDQFFREKVRCRTGEDVAAGEPVFGGWLGRYRARIASALPQKMTRFHAEHER